MADVQVRIRDVDVREDVRDPRHGNQPPETVPSARKSSHRLVRLARNCVSPLLERRSAMSTMMGVVLIAVMFVMFGGGGAYYGAKAADKNLT